MFDHVSKRSDPIVTVVVSPLVNVMEDQVKHLIAEIDSEYCFGLAISMANE